MTRCNHEHIENNIYIVSSYQPLHLATEHGTKYRSAALGKLQYDIYYTCPSN